jgi:hypothetical protein
MTMRTHNKSKVCGSATLVFACLLLAGCGETAGSADMTDQDAGNVNAQEDASTSGECDGLDGCPCSHTAACATGFVCDAHTSECRAAKRCEDLSCEAHRQCVPSDQGDASCGECDEGYHWNDTQKRCDAVPSCDPKAPGSIVQSCAAENRSCDDTSGSATCGVCLQGSKLMAGSCVAADCSELACPSPQSCALNGDSASCTGCIAGYHWSDKAKQCIASCSVTKCSSDEQCVEGDADHGAQCVNSTECATGLVHNDHGVCVPCGACYVTTHSKVTLRTGALGLANAGAAFAGKCVCEVAQGYFQSQTGEVLACDGDRDGFKNRRATVLAGTPFQQKCETHLIDRFTLVSDDAPANASPGVSRSLDVTVQTLVETFNLDNSSWKTDPIAKVAVMELVEDEAMDEAEKFSDRYDSQVGSFPLRPYGSGKASFRPEHANPLTKVCNYADDDFNMDGLPDVKQAQGMAPLESRPPELAGFASMAFFVELAEGKYESGNGKIGRYVIRERARSRTGDVPLPFRFDTGNTVSSYETTCLRSRDASFPGLPGGNVPPTEGYDFAYWQCTKDSESGPCATRGKSGRALAHVAYDGRKPLFAEALEKYGAAELGHAVPWDVATDAARTGQPALWPGMNHHSQFKCIPRDPAKFSVPEANQAQPRKWDRYDCSLASAGSAGAQPDFTCGASTQAPTASASYQWAVARYKPYSAGSYERGCIDEPVEWSFACPEWSARWGDGADKSTPFMTDDIGVGQFTCQTECQRDGIFLATQSGAMCCFGAPADCTYDLLSAPGKESLLCALPGNTMPLDNAPYCSAALGDFVWAADQGGEYDPNALKWAGATGPSFQDTVWE